MKAGWASARIGDLAELVTKGTTPTSVGFNFTEDGVNFVKVECINGTGSLIPSKFAKIGLDCHNALLRSQLKEGDLLFSIAGALGRAALVTPEMLPANTNQALAIIRPEKTAGLDRRFLLYALSPSLIADQIDQFRGGVAQQNLSLAQVRDLRIPLPPLDEQKRIVAVLDEAFEGLSRARANAEANLADARELFGAVHKEALTRRAGGGRKVTMADVTEIASTLVDPKLPEYSSLPHVGAGNMPTCSDQLLDVQTAAEEGLTSGKFLFDRRMVLYSKIRPYLRKASRPDFDGVCSADVYPLLPKAGVLERDYLFYLLLGPDFTEYAISGSARAGMPKVNREHLFKYSFKLPDTDRQRNIAALLDETLAQSRALEAEYGSKLDALDTLRQSLLRKAFSGDLM